MKQLKAGRRTVTFFNNQPEKENVMKKMTATLMVVIVLFAFFGMATQANAAKVYTVKAGDTLSKIAGKNWKAVCETNSLKDCSKIRVGQKLSLTSTIANKPTVTSGEFRWVNIGGAPLKGCGGKTEEVLNEEAWTKLGLSSDEKNDLRAMIALNEHKNVFFHTGERYLAVAFCEEGHVSFKRNVLIDWKDVNLVVSARTYVLRSGKKLHWVRNCNNWVLGVPETPTPIVVESPPMPLPPVVESPPLPMYQPPPAVKPEPGIVPFHMTEEKAESPKCELQAGTGIYGNGVYQGAWAYGESICYVWKDGEWQAGPGLYAMYGSGHSLTSDYRGKEVGVGLQAGIQRNWINDRNNRVSADLKLRWTTDRSWGSNSESGYSFTQKGQKIGLYGGYAERINKQGDLLGATIEYWKSFGQTVSSTWAGQPVQDRGSVGVAAFYETKISDDNKWRQRIIGGVARTNWDEQNWLKGTYEIRYDEWLMFGPQISLPISVSQPNQPLSARDLTTVGAFVRVELGNKVREADANKKETQLEFIPAGSLASSDAGRPAPEATEPPE